MSFIYPFLLVIHVLFSLSLIIAVLLQSSKGEGLAGAFGGGTGLSGAVFGGRGAATFLSKATSVLAIGFMVTSISLFIAFGLRGTGSSAGSGVLDDLQEGQINVAPSVPSAVPGEAQPGEGEQNPTDIFDQAAPAGDTSGQ